jgi:hypothetical protein
MYYKKRGFLQLKSAVALMSVPAITPLSQKHNQFSEALFLTPFPATVVLIAL